MPPEATESQSFARADDWCTMNLVWYRQAAMLAYDWPGGSHMVHLAAAQQGDAERKPQQAIHKRRSKQTERQHQHAQHGDHQSSASREAGLVEREPRRYRRTHHECIPENDQ